jgi:hypothetical protein
VDRINQYSFYELGKKLGQLEVGRGEVDAQGIFGAIFNTRSILASLLRGDPFPLTVSRQCAIVLRDSIESVWDSVFSTKDGDGAVKFRYPDENEKIASWIWSRVTTALEHFETVFAEEMREAATYYVPRRGIFFTPALVDAADETFPVEVASFIPPKAKADWQAAGRCLAFNILTAAGFHVARSVEGMLEAYYQFFSGKPGEELVSWHEYIKALDTILQGPVGPKPLVKTLAELKQMKDDYRNPIAHPRVALNEPEARILFANGESLIIAMAQELKSAAQAGQPPLALVAPAPPSAA